MQGLSQKGLQPDSPGKGISALKGGEFFMRDSKGKVFLTSEWFTVKRYVEHFEILLNKKDEKGETVEPNMFPCVLKIDLRLSQQKGFIFRDETDKPPIGKDGKPIPVPGGSYYMTKGVPASQIAVALHLYPTNLSESQKYYDHPDWHWTPITTLTFEGNRITTAGKHMMPIIPDLPREGMDTHVAFPTAAEVIKYHLR